MSTGTFPMRTIGTITRSLPALTLCLLAACVSVGDAPVTVEMTGYGIIQSQRVVMRHDDTSSVGAQRADARSMHVALKTERIPLRPGLSYGIAFRVVRAPGEEVKLKAILRTSAPCVLKDSGRVVYHNDSMLTVRVGQLRHLAARIPASESENHCAGEPQPGTDTFEIWFEDRKLVEKTFHVYRE